MKNQELLTTSANAPHDLLVCVDVAGNGKSILLATGAEVREGRLIISCEAPAQKKEAATAKAAKAANQPAAPTQPAPTPADGKPAAPASESSGETVE